MTKTTLLLTSTILVVLIPLSCSSSIGEFAKKVQPVLRSLIQRYDGISKCIDTALEKAESLREEEVRNMDSYYAVILINMYSNPSCSLSKTDNEGVFYKKLNKELQNNRPSGPESRLWRKVGKLMNKALEIPRPRIESAQVVYRGCVYNPDFSGREFRFRKITSTSKDPQVAGIYSDFCKTFILIEDALGLDIEKYTQIPGEAEILLQSTNVYAVEKHTRNESEIRNEMDNILPGMQPELFVRLRQKQKQSFFSRCLFGFCRT